MDFLSLRSAQELNTAVSRQRVITRRVLLELDRLAESLVPQEMNEEDETEIAGKLRLGEVRLLKKYSALPTLRELQIQPHLRGVSGEEGTFGVAAIVGEVLLSSIRAIEPRFSRVHRLLLMLLMREIDNPEQEEADIIGIALRFMRIELKAELNGISEDERQRLLRALLRPLVETMILVMQEYGLVEWVEERGYRLTPVGKRVMMHLYDVQVFIDTVARAHIGLQGEVAPLVPDAEGPPPART